MKWLDIPFEDTAVGSSDTDTVFFKFYIFKIVHDFVRVKFSFSNEINIILILL